MNGRHDDSDSARYRGDTLANPQPQAAAAQRRETPFRLPNASAPHSATTQLRKAPFGVPGFLPKHPATITRGILQSMTAPHAARSRMSCGVAALQRSAEKQSDEKSRGLLATRLKQEADKAMAAAEKKGKPPMEIQTAYFANKEPVWLMAANAAKFYNAEDLARPDKTWIVLSDTLHAEQQILWNLAKRLANPNCTPPGYAIIIGTKRPCTLCRRVLLAFQDALQEAKYETCLHFVNSSGADTDPAKVACVDFNQFGDGNKQFERFREVYERQLKVYLDKKLGGEQESGSVRSKATPEVKELT